MTPSKTIKTVLLFAAEQFKVQDFSNEAAKLESQLLLQHALNVNRAWLIAHAHENLATSIEAAYLVMLERRLNGEPIAYILGYREFYSLKLKVSADTLIPRPDTETLVDAALAKIPSLLSFRRKSESSDLKLLGKKTLDYAAQWNDECKVLDLGTGTGAIALAIAKHRPNALLTAVDASQAALNIAVENAKSLNILNVTFLLSNWFSALNHENINEKFDCIVSNPPYIEAADAHLKQGDLRFEPLSALASGADGMDAIRTIIQNAAQHLNQHGWLLLEHGYNQADKVALLLKQAGFSEISHVKDSAGIHRVTLGQLR